MPFETPADFSQVDLELSLDEHSLPEPPTPAAVPDEAALIRVLTEERSAAYRQMQRMMQDISQLREREQHQHSARQGLMAEMYFRLAVVSEYRKGGTMESVLRVGTLSALLAHQMGWPDSYCDAMQLAAPLHDLGEICLPDRLLSMDEHDPEMRLAMRAHCMSGSKLLASTHDMTLTLAASIAEAHHERYDGSGYPKGLSGEDIPPAARIVAVVDVFDAMTCERPYRAALSAPSALAFVLGSPGLFDPAVLDALRQIRDRFLTVRWVLDPAHLSDELRLAIERELKPNFWRRFVE